MVDEPRGEERMPAVTRCSPFGTVFGLSWVGKSGQAAVFSGARGGVAWSPDEGDTWNELDGFLDFWAVSFANQHAGWMVGGEGRIVKISF